MKTKRFRSSAFFCGLAVFLLTGACLTWAQEESHAVVLRATKHAIAPPLSQTVPIPPHSGLSTPLAESEDNDRAPIHGPRATGLVQDSVLQISVSADAAVSAALSPLAVNSGINILGLGNGFPGYSLQANVPDTNGAVGATQFVQFVNDSFVVFNKSNGSVAYGPASGNTLWQSLGGPCAAHTNLDEIVQYDKLANRWVMMMPVFGGPPYLCIAVSSSSNAVTSSWHLYAFQPPTSKICGCRLMPDYPKLAVWPDAYYISYNQGYNSVFQGAGVCAVDRNSMLNGSAATMQCFMSTPTSYGSLLPADLDGTTAPPSGSPQYYLAFGGDNQSVNLWQLNINWTTPANSTFTGPRNIPVAAFNEACGETAVQLNYTSGACVPQSGTSQGLDSYGDRLMYRVAYRNFGDHESLVANHTVNSGTSSNNTAIRWYELQSTGSGFTLYQQGTYNPDSTYRWMGSIAMDGAGDIAMGYSASSSSISPTIRYTGRLSTDPLGQMGSEVDVLSQAGVGHASQTNTFHWADYSSISVDPTDDCTFWYTTEYQPANGGNHWATRIASFSFPTCGGTTSPPPPAWAVVNKASNFGNPLASLTIPASGTGNLIAVALMFSGSTSVSSVSDNVGNTYVSAGARATNGSLSTEIWYVANSNAGATVITPHFVGSPGHVEITSWEVSGLSTGAPDAKNTASGAVTLNNTPGPAVTTTKAGDFIVSVLFAGSANFTSITAGNEFTNDFKTNGNGWAHLTSNSAGVGTHQASWNTAGPAGVYCASTVAFHQ